MVIELDIEEVKSDKESNYWHRNVCETVRVWRIGNVEKQIPEWDRNGEDMLCRRDMVRPVDQTYMWLKA